MTRDKGSKEEAVRISNETSMKKASGQLGVSHNMLTG